jgi:hypothetical protein
MPLTKKANANVSVSINNRHKIKLNILLLAASMVVNTHIHALEHQPKYLPYSYTQYMYAPSEHTQILDSLGNQVQVNIIDRQQNKPLPIYFFKREYWVAGTPNTAYAVTLSSRLKDRKALATVSIDGVNVVTGEDAHVLQRGYVLSPNKHYSITGWRKSQSEIAAFKFAHPTDSYAASTNRPNNIGMIGVAVFPEQYQLPASPLVLEDVSNPQKKPLILKGNRLRAEISSAHTQKLGTQHGVREVSQSTVASFKRDSHTPSELIVLRYDTIDNLVARGVLRWTPETHAQQPIPNAFPNNNYVPDPPRN